METRMKLPVKQSLSFFMVIYLTGFLSACLNHGSSEKEGVVPVTDVDEIYMEDIFGEPVQTLEEIVTAIVKNDLPAFKKRITSETINEVIPMGELSEWTHVTPLAAAIEYGRNDMIRYLVEMKAELTYTGEGGLPEKIQPLIVAASKNRLDLIRSFTEKAADGLAGTFFPVSYKEYGKYVTPLEVACRANNKEVEAYLRWLGATEEDLIIKRRGRDWAISGYATIHSFYRSYSDLSRYLQPETGIKGVNDPTYDLVRMIALRRKEGYNLEEVKGYVEKGADINMFLVYENSTGKKERYLTPLMSAAYLGYGDVVEYLIGKGANIHAVNHFDENALFAAMRGGDMTIIDLLLKNGAVPYRTTRKDNSSYYEAVGKSPELLHRLLKLDDTVLTDPEFLDYLSANGESSVFEYMAGKGMRIDSIPDLFYPAMQVGAWDMVHNLLEQGANINLVKRRELPVIEMAKKGYWSRVKYLLERGADINSRERKGQSNLSLFQMAVEARRYDVVLYMAGRGADIERLLDKSGYANWVVDAADVRMADLLRKASEYHRKRSYSQNGYTHLHNATLLYGPEAVEDAFLLGIPVNAQDSAGNTPLHTLMLGTKEEKEYKPVIDFLIKNGARLNARNKEGKTPFYLAIEYNKPASVVEYLIELGAGIEVPDHYGQTPLFAAIRKSPELLALLLEKGANVNAPSFYRRITPLHLAVEMRNRHTLEKLVQYGANPALTDRFGNTPLELARSKGAGFMDMFVYLEGN